MKYLLHHLLRNSAEKFPEKKVVRFQNQIITYQELEILSNKLANFLIESSVKRGDRVGLFLNKSIEYVVSIFGILKAGAAYVPIDPKAPPSRVSYIINNCRMKCLISSINKIKSNQKTLEKLNFLNTVIITDGYQKDFKLNSVNLITWDVIVDHPKKKSPVLPTIDNDLAYILHTSGSTGVPKGVMITHRNALTFINWAQSIFHLTSNDRLSNHAPFHFDLSVFDIFAAVNIGATVILVPELISYFPIRLAEWIEKNKITVWYSVPSILTMMVQHGNLENRDFTNLRIILFAGEVFPTKYLKQLMETIPHPEYYNLYGPTETNVITYYKINNIPTNINRTIPIGKACENMEVFAITENGELVTEPGEEGELYARGSCVAKGYWGDIKKTNERFVRNPLNPNIHDIVYKTGDIVSIDEEGNYIFKGRKDHMIKSRGYRIELGEIETVFYSHPNIKEVAVIAVPDEVIGNRIYAFIVPNDCTKLDSANLRIFCGKKLPPYMIPEKFEILEALPKTSTGKIDKTSLQNELIETSKFNFG